MKFNKVARLFLVLSASASVYCKIKKPVNDVQERHRRQCRAQLAAYNDCHFNVWGVPYDDLRAGCRAYRSDHCQNYYRNPQGVVPNCYLTGSLGRFPQLNESSLNATKKIRGFVCSATPDDTPCPFLDYMTTLSMSELENAVTENCKFKGCTKGLIDLLESTNFSNQSELDLFKDVYDFVKSSKCGREPYRRPGNKKTTTTTKKTTTTTKKTTTTTTKKTTTTTTKKTTTTTIPKKTTTTTTPKKTTTTTTEKPVATTTAKKPVTIVITTTTTVPSASTTVDPSVVAPTVPVTTTTTIAEPVKFAEPTGSDSETEPEQKLKNGDDGSDTEGEQKDEQKAEQKVEQKAEQKTQKKKCIVKKKSN